MKTVSEILSAAADLIEPEGAWTQGHYARGVSGRPVVTVQRAICFCALGAINVAAGLKPNEDSREAQRVLESILPWPDVPIWNDDPERTQADVLAALRKAAALAREQSQ